MTSRGMAVLSSSRLLLAAVWVTALASIPSRTAYQEQLDSGVKPADITTFYDSVSFMVSVASVVTWVVAGRWLRDIVTASHAGTLAPAWAMWGWIVPVVQFWFPRRIVRDALGARAATDPRMSLNTWWFTWLGFMIVSNYTTLSLFVARSMTPTGNPVNPILPNLELAGACLLTGSYLVWQRIVVALDTVA